MYQISKEFAFSAAHRLFGLREGHPCSREHGHNYIVRLVLQADWLDDTGFVRDYGDLNEFKKWIDEVVDHRHLNDIMADQTSAENLAAWIYNTWTKRYPELIEVWVSETPRTWAMYRPGDLS